MPAASRRLLLFASLAAACECASAPEAPPDAGTDAAPARCPLPVVRDGDPFDPDARFAESMRAFDAAWEAHADAEALACAQEACRLAPDEPRAHLDRALALEGTGRLHDAHLAFGRALALDPEDPEILRAFGDFLFRDGSDDALETAVQHARHGREHAEAVLAADLAALEAAALNALGRPAEALVAAESSAALDGERADGLVERGIALFELLRFDEAERTLADARARDPDNARAAHFHGLVAERLGRAADAARSFADASRLDPEGFPPPLELAPAEFAAIVDEERRALEPADQARLSRAELGWEELPALDDLRAGDPILSPTIVGLFRPGERGARDAILLYRRNLLRLVRTRDELRREVRDTLLHELGHLAGENDAELRDRGL